MTKSLPVRWMGKIHFAPPKKPANASSPINTNSKGFSHGFISVVRTDFVHPQQQLRRWPHDRRVHWRRASAADTFWSDRVGASLQIDHRSHLFSLSRRSHGHMGSFDHGLYTRGNRGIWIRWSNNCSERVSLEQRGGLSMGALETQPARRSSDTNLAHFPEFLDFRVTFLKKTMFLWCILPRDVRTE